MFGYATNETEELMPMSHLLASKLALRLTEVRKSGELKWLRPDGKTQVTMEYEKIDGHVKPKRVHTILISTQHDENISNEEISKQLIEKVIKPIVPKHLLDDKTIYHINPSGKFVVGGPQGVSILFHEFNSLGCRIDWKKNYC